MNAVEKKKTVLIMAGGTGGHVFPALSIASYLQGCGVAVEWLGTKSGLESTIVPGAGITLNVVNIGGLRGKSIWQKVFSPLRILRAVSQSLKHIKRIQPDCVLGLGGFVAGPGGVAAWLGRVPLVIHEQNAIAGFTNMMLLPFSKVVMQAFPKSFEKKRKVDSSIFTKLVWNGRKKIETVGNPLREEIVALSKHEVTQKLDENKKMRVLVIGGSLGAVAINEVIPQVISSLGSEYGPDFWHQCGGNNLEETLSFYQALGVGVNGKETEENQKIKVTPFIEDMAAAYQWADLIVCRSGALTVSEVAAVGIASVLIPYPSAVDDHQTENAQFLVDHGAAKLLPQDQLSRNSLLRLIRELVFDRPLVKLMSERAGKLGCVDSASQAGLFCLGVCND